MRWDPAELDEATNPKTTPVVPSARWWSRRVSSVPLWVWVIGAVVALATVSRVISGAADERSASAGPVPVPPVAITEVADPPESSATTVATPPTSPPTTTLAATTTLAVTTSTATTSTATTSPATSTSRVVPQATILVTVASSPCDRNYSGACVPVADDVDCAGTGGDGPAFVSGPVEIIGDDVYDLDGVDRDGVGCDT